MVINWGEKIENKPLKYSINMNQYLDEFNCSDTYEVTEDMYNKIGNLLEENSLHCKKEQAEKGGKK